MKYRIYIDEVGNPDLKASTNINHRYLSLTGVIMELDYVRSIAHPSLEDLKQKYFDPHPDETLVFHRSELMNHGEPFSILKDSKVEKAFNRDLMCLLSGLQFEVMTVVLDKLDFLQRYAVWHFDPYHYCLIVLVERFVLWLRERQSKGDVMAESRGGHEDMRLKIAFRNLVQMGSDFIPSKIMRGYLTSEELKVKPKACNIAGLQIADLIAHPSFKAVLARHQNQALATNFGGRIAQLLEKSKYCRNKKGKLDGYGRKWLP